MLCPWARHFICIAPVDSAVEWVPGGDILVKGVQCYELFEGIALKNHAFYLFIKAYVVSCERSRFLLLFYRPPGSLVQGRWVLSVGSEGVGGEASRGEEWNLSEGCWSVVGQIPDGDCGGHNARTGMLVDLAFTGIKGLLPASAKASECFPLRFVYTEWFFLHTC